jgi:beta-lactam-binding protein with PASTA domain
MVTDGSPTAVPDFLGLSLREAIEKSRSMKVKVKMQGYGYVVKQSPVAGGRWNEDDVVVLNLQG